MVLEVKNTGGEGGVSETAGEQGKGVRNNRNDQAARCSTGNERGGEVGGDQGHRGPMRNWYPEQNSLNSTCFCLCWTTENNQL